MKRVKVLISGVVQGVAFRASVRHRAIMLDIKGYVKNLENGDVVAILEGDDSKIEEMVKYCKKGPLIAKVNEIKISYQKYKNEYNNFEIRY